MKSFVAVVKALLSIRDSNLYREDFKTFNEYCHVRWGMSRHYAGKLISGSQVAANLCITKEQSGDIMSPTLIPCEIQPTLEHHCRPLVILEPLQQREVWE
jgi:hypothetical protein